MRAEAVQYSLALLDYAKRCPLLVCAKQSFREVNKQLATTMIAICPPLHPGGPTAQRDPGTGQRRELPTSFEGAWASRCWHFWLRHLRLGGNQGARESLQQNLPPLRAIELAAPQLR